MKHPTKNCKESKNHFYGIIFMAIILLTSFLFTRCNKFLEVQPSDKVLDKDLFKNRSGVYGALNGIYTQLNGDDLYGKNLTILLPDLLAQYYAVYPSEYYQLVDGNYANSTTENILSAIWDKSYNIILQSNTLIGHLNRNEIEDLSREEHDILLGESMAMRALLHFDLFRLFGPVYSVDPNMICMPYNDNETQQILPLLSAVEIVEKIKLDLDRAMQYLKNDPIRKNGIVNITDNNSSSNYLKRRNLRLNYYAVIALQARLALYVGNTTDAYNHATSLINETKVIFSWSPSDATLPGDSEKDLFFTSEHIFALYNQNMYTNHEKLFSSSLIDGLIFRPEDQGLKKIYENNMNDYRYRSWWRQDPISKQTSKVFVKFEKPLGRNTSSHFMMPFMKISEMYYIAAETSPSEDKGREYINAVRKNRGISKLSNSEDLNTAILNEYRKEFWGEGQLFFYYKRLNFSNIQSTIDEDYFITFSKDRYVLPIPKNELYNKSSN